MRVMTADDVAGLLKISKQRLYEMVRGGLIPCLYMGRQIRFSEAELQKWMADGGTRLPGGWRREPEQDASRATP